MRRAGCGQLAARGLQPVPADEAVPTSDIVILARAGQAAGPRGPRSRASDVAGRWPSRWTRPRPTRANCRLVPDILLRHSSLPSECVRIRGIPRGGGRISSAASRPACQSSRADARTRRGLRPRRTTRPRVLSARDACPPHHGRADGPARAGHGRDGRSRPDHGLVDRWTRLSSAACRVPRRKISFTATSRCRWASSSIALTFPSPTGPS